MVKISDERNKNKKSDSILLNYQTRFFFIIFMWTQNNHSGRTAHAQTHTQTCRVGVTERTSEEKNRKKGREKKHKEFLVETNANGFVYRPAASIPAHTYARQKLATDCIASSAHITVPIDVVVVVIAAVAIKVHAQWCTPHPFSSERHTNCFVFCFCILPSLSIASTIWSHCNASTCRLLQAIDCSCPIHALFGSFVVVYLFTSPLFCFYFGWKLRMNEKNKNKNELKNMFWQKVYNLCRPIETHRPTYLCTTTTVVTEPYIIIFVEHVFSLSTSL